MGPTDVLRPLTRQVGVVLAANSGPMTLDGTNSYVLSGNGSGFIVVDPGPGDVRHQAALAAVGPVELILITHRHADHTEGAPALAELTGASVRAFDADQCHAGGRPLTDGEVIDGAGLSVAVVHTPGHTADSVCFLLAADEPSDGPGWRGSVLTGDTILGRGTTVIAHPDGAVAPYLDSLDKLEHLGPRHVLPAHGPELPDLTAVCREYRQHRLMRLDEVRAALATLSNADLTADGLADAVVDVVYPDVDPRIRSAAGASVRAQLAYLRA